MTDQPPDNVIPLRDEGPPTMETLLASTVLVWDEGEQIRLRCQQGVPHSQIADWLRHLADHLDGEHDDAPHPGDVT